MATDETESVTILEAFSEEVSGERIAAGNARPRGVRRWLRVPRWLAIVAVSLFVVGLLVRLTIADRVVVASTIYYSTPWAVLAGLALVCVTYAHQRRFLRSRRIWFCVTAVCAGIWLWNSWYSSSVAVPERSLRVVTWNMCHGNRSLPGLVQAMARLNPDIAVVVEGDPKKLDVRPIFQEAFPEHHISILGNGIVVVSRWPSGEATAYSVGEHETESRIREIDVETPWGPWTIFAADLGSNLFYSRRKPIEELCRLIDRHKDHPVIVAGDFNTPLDSEHYSLFREIGLKELFLTAGEGYLPTWPVPIPVLSLDQIWVNEHLTPVHCERAWNWRSDHAAAVGTVSPR